ncbi:MAG: thiamine phosphate synthase [Candidatus Coatesbacteria bacterium]
MSTDRIPFRLYAITDRLQLGNRPLAEALEMLGRAGLKGVEVREKDLDEAALGELATACGTVMDRYRIAWLVNGPPAVALAAGATGVHVPAPGDAAAARAAVGLERLVAQSAHGVAEARSAARAGADFVVVGPIFETPSKALFGPPLGTGVLAAACAAAAPVPVFAIGGVTPERSRACLEAGAAGVAVLGPLMRAAAGTSPEGMAREVLARYADALGAL